MSNIDLGNNPVGTPPTLAEQAQIRTAIGLSGLNSCNFSLLTASPNNTTNVVRLSVTGGAANTDLVLSPKGTGAFILGPEPDGTTTGGNKRGANAVDLQATRTAATQIASGNGSFTAGYKNTASGTNSIAIGEGCTASDTAVAIGVNCTASGFKAFAAGDTALASGGASVALGYAQATGSESFAAVSNAKAQAQFAVSIGRYTTSSADRAYSFGESALSDRSRMWSFGATNFNSANGAAQFVKFVPFRKTTDATPTTLMLDGNSTRLTIPSGKVFSFIAQITGIKSDGSAVAQYVRKGCIKNVSLTTSLVGAIETIGTDHEDAATDVNITADDTNDALNISVTGIASETWRWVAVVEGVEVAYGT